jgi:hypothetical protein
MAQSAREQAVAAYSAAWKTADEQARRNVPERSFATDGSHADPAATVARREAMVATKTGAYRTRGALSTPPVRDGRSERSGLGRPHMSARPRRS